MRKKLISILLSSTILLSVLPCSVQADSLDESKTKYTEVSSELKDLDNEIAKIKTQIDELNTKITDNENKIKETQDTIEKKQNEIKSLNDDIDTNQDLLDNRLREMYKNGTTSSSSVLDFILKSNSLSDLISRVSSAKTVVTLDHKLISETKDKVSTVENSKKEIESEKESLESLNNQTKSDLDTVNSKNNELNDKKAKLSNELAKIASSIEENENNLVKNQINIANTSNNIDDLQMSVATLESLLPQLSIQSIIDKTKAAISTGKGKISSLKAAGVKPASRGDSNGIMPAFNPSSAKKTLTLEATAYTANTTTAMGSIPIRNPGGISSVAVDEDLIPLGTKMYISGYGYAIACDTGSAIKGNRIDLFMNSESDCLSFGRKEVTAYIIAYPGEW